MERPFQESNDLYEEDTMSLGPHDPRWPTRRDIRHSEVPVGAAASDLPEGPPADPFLPPLPTTAEDSGLDFGFLADLALKAAYADTNCTTQRAAQQLALPVGVVDVLLQHLYREHFIEIRETLSQQNRRYAMLDRGWERVRRLLDLNAYIGAAPVSLAAYSAMVKHQEAHRPPIDNEAIRSALAELVLPEATLQVLGVVANSRRSLFITGAPGNGKTSIARALHAALRGDIWVPRAIEVDGQVINVFDSHTIESMDLTYDQTVKFYEAPFQIKSNGGTLLIDDFGRQRIQPRDLFNRWIIPLENRVDYLTLHTGKKIQVPFEQQLIFASNLSSSDFGEEAFLRRLGYRLAADSPSPEIYARIFQKYVEAQRLRHDARLVEGLVARYRQEQREMRSCQPRDLVDRCRDICRYENRPFALTRELLDRAWLYYFGARPS
jgi:hypothetical protein